MDPRARIYVAGGDTLIGKTLIESLLAAGHEILVGMPPHEPDLTQAIQVDDFFAEARPEYVFVAAGQSGGIEANVCFPAELMLNNLLVSTHVIDVAHRHGVKKLLYLASSCVYPKCAPQPLRLDCLQSGPLEPTNEAYATAKLAGLRLCQAYRRQYDVNFIVGIPANAFGPHDNFSPQTGHVIPALMRRMHEAKLNGDDTFTVWGTGAPRREFIYAADLADACLHVMKHYDGDEPINLGVGTDYSVAETAQRVANVVGFRGRLRFDASKPDGMPRKLLDSSKLFGLGWKPTTDLRDALAATYAWYLEQEAVAPVVEIAS
jgi:GDP-L-fucose synthase